uniref:Uncharacterized protein n=1 Tax=Rhizophora mucronata TaxID=61149 RepID=A0A2P2Q5L8_RHIMU
MQQSCERLTEMKKQKSRVKLLYCMKDNWENASSWIICLLRS